MVSGQHVEGRLVHILIIIRDAILCAIIARIFHYDKALIVQSFCLHNIKA